MWLLVPKLLLRLLLLLQLQLWWLEVRRLSRTLHLRELMLILRLMLRLMLRLLLRLTIHATLVLRLQRILSLWWLMLMLLVLLGLLLVQVVLLLLQNARSSDEPLLSKSLSLS